MEYISNYFDLSILTLVTLDQIGQTPCEILSQPIVIDMVLNQKNATYFIDWDYWFGNNNPMCTTHNGFNCSTWGSNETQIQPNTGQNNDECLLKDDDECPFPLVRSSYNSWYTTYVGLGRCNCGLKCDTYFFGGSIKKLVCGS